MRILEYMILNEAKVVKIWKTRMNYYSSGTICASACDTYVTSCCMRASTLHACACV